MADRRDWILANVPARAKSRRQQVQRVPRVHSIGFHWPCGSSISKPPLESRQDLEIDQVDDIEFHIIDCIDGRQLVVDLSRP